MNSLQPNPDQKDAAPDVVSDAQGVAEALARAQTAVATAIFFDDVAQAVVAGGVALANAQEGALWLRTKEVDNLSLALGSSKPETETARAPREWTCVLLQNITENGAAKVQWRDTATIETQNASSIETQKTAIATDGDLARSVEKAARGEIVFDMANAAIPLSQDGVVIAVLQLGWDESQRDEAQGDQTQRGEAEKRDAKNRVLDADAFETFAQSAALGLTRARLFEQIESAKCEWETAFDGMVDGVVIESEDGTILRANLIAAAFYGCEVSQVVGRTSEELCARLADYQQLRVLKPLKGDASGRDVRTGEFRFGTPARIILETVSALRLSPYRSGRARPATRDASTIHDASTKRDNAENSAERPGNEPISDERQSAERQNGESQNGESQNVERQSGERQSGEPHNNEARRVVRVLRDITEQRRLGEQLIQSEKLAALGELISGVAHELNNPLTTVTGYAQLLQEDASLPAHARRQISHIYEDASRAARIVANLLSFVRREDTRSDAVDINETLRHLAEMRTYQLQSENVRLTFEYSNDLPLVVGDSHQLQQVFLNIINNAQHALHEWRGGGTVSVETKRVLVEGAPGVLVSFVDNGPGIAPDHLRRLFDPFWTTKQAGEGTGLGMSISLDIVSRHGGRIWVESTMGQGARFFIELPGASEETLRSADLDLSSTQNETRAEDAEHLENVVEETVEGAQILVVDDEEPVILLMSEVLGLDDHEVTPAFNGGEALALLQERDFNLIISDVRMPAVGGPTFFEILQTTRPDLLPRVVFVTGDTMSRSTQDFLRQANRPMLAKPFDPDRLRALVRDQLQRNR